MSGSTPTPPQMAMPSPVYQYQNMPGADAGAYGNTQGQGALGAQAMSNMGAYTPALTGSTTQASGWNPGATTDFGNFGSAQSAPMFTSANGMLDQFVNNSPTGIGTPAYQQAAQMTQDQIRASNAANGVGGSPYSAGLESQGMGQFNTNWQNNQVAQESQAANAAGSLFGQGMNAITGGQQTAMASPVAQMGLAQGTTQLPGMASQVPQQMVQDFLQYLQGGTGATQAQNQAIAGLNNSLNQNFSNQIAAQNSSNSLFSGLGNMAGNMFGANGMFGSNGALSLAGLFA